MVQFEEYQNDARYFKKQTQSLEGYEELKKQIMGEKVGLELYDRLARFFD